LLDLLILHCKQLNANSIVLVCRPEQIVYLKSRYGDVLYWNRNAEIYKTITMFYISVSTRYFGKYDSITFNQIYGAHIFNNATLDSFGRDYANSFILIDPRLLFDPLTKMQIFEHIRSYFYGSKGDMLFSKQEERVPHYAYSILTVETIKQLWNILSTTVKNKPSIIEFAKLDLKHFYDQIKQPERIFELLFPIHHLGQWQEYVELLSSIQNASEDERELLYMRCMFNKTVLSFRRFSLNNIVDTPFSQKIVEFNNSTKAWSKRRLEIRKNNDRK